MQGDRKFRICDAMNTWMPALNLLRSRGYSLFISPDSRPEFYGDFWAIKDGRDFVADTPLALFGLIAIWEAHGDGEDWQPKHRQYCDINDELASIAFPMDAYSDLTDQEVADAIRYWTPFFEARGVGIPKDRFELYQLFCPEQET